MKDMHTVSMPGSLIFRFILTISLTCALHLYSFAAEKKNQIFEFENNRIAFSGAFSNSSTWQLDFSYHYMINRYIGFGGSLGLWKTAYPEGQPKGNDWYAEWDSNDISNIFIRPSIILKTPPLRIKKMRDWNFRTTWSNDERPIRVCHITARIGNDWIYAEDCKHNRWPMVGFGCKTRTLCQSWSMRI